MEPNSTNKEPAPISKEGRNFKCTEIKLYYVSEYVTRDELDYHKKDSHKFGSDGLSSEMTLVQKKFHCQCLCHGIKNWGREICEQPRIKEKTLQDFYKKHRYMVICRDCLRDCFICGSPTSTISGTKRDGKWHCVSCNKKAKRKEFWQKVINILGGKWW